MKDLRSLKSLLPQAIEVPDALRGGRAQKTLREWEKIVGVDMATRSWPDRWEKGTVWVACTGSAWAQELRMMKDDILARLREESGEPGLFHDIRFGVRKLNRPASIANESEEVVTTVVSEGSPEATPTKQLTISEIAARRLAAWKDAQ